MSRHKQSIPDRWLEYTPIGKRIHVTPFLAFKVPLKNTSNNVSPERKFSPSDLIEAVPNLSLVIDLTNTQKYYSGNDFLDSGIEYRKIFCPGHQIPPVKLIRKFFEIVDEFMEKTRNCSVEDEVRLIGVHCTHGINRTGFFICSYMINKLGYNSEEAILEFNSARGHNIERENYLNALKKYDIHPLQFKSTPLPHDDTNSTEHLDSVVDAEDRFIPHNSYRRQRSWNSSNDHAYRSARNWGRNAWQDSNVFRHQPIRRNFNFYEDYPIGGSSFWHYQHPYTVNLETIDPYFHSVQRRRPTYGNGYRRY